MGSASKNYEIKMHKIKEHAIPMFFKKTIRKGIEMVDQNISWASKNMDDAHFFDVQDIRDEISLREEYDSYNKTVEDFNFNHFSSIEYIPKDEDEVRKESTKENDEKQQTITIGEIKKKYPLGMPLLKECAENLQLEHIVDERSSLNVQDMERLITECKRVNVLKANENNPLYKKDTKVKVKLEHTNMKSIEFLVRNGYLIFIDTCSLMNDNMFDIIKYEFIPLLEQYNAQLYITNSVTHEINVNLKSKDISTYEKAESARNILMMLGKKGLYVEPITSDTNKYFADADLISIFCEQRLKHRLCLITNDNKISNEGGLAGSITKLRKDPNIKGIKDIKVFSVSHDEGSRELIEFDATKDANYTLHPFAPKRVKL